MGVVVASVSMLQVADVPSSAHAICAWCWRHATRWCRVNDALLGDPTEMAASRAAGWKHDAAQHQHCAGARLARRRADRERAGAAHVSLRVAVSAHVGAGACRASRAAASRRCGCSARARPRSCVSCAADTPPAFDRTYRAMAESGHRVLALAWRRLSDSRGGARHQERRLAGARRGRARPALCRLCRHVVPRAQGQRRRSAAAARRRAARRNGDGRRVAHRAARCAPGGDRVGRASRRCCSHRRRASPTTKPPHWELAIRSPPRRRRAADRLPRRRRCAAGALSTCWW
jgi:hypothetical protein